MCRLATPVVVLWCRLATLLVCICVGLPHICPSCHTWPSLGVMAPKKRAPSMTTQEIAVRASLETHVTQSAAARLLQPTVKGKGKVWGSSLRQGRRKCGALVHKPSLMSTPYGQVVKKMEVDTVNGPVQLDYVCPHSWLYVACSMCQPFARFLTGCLSQGLPGQETFAGSICIYSDEV